MRKHLVDQKRSQAGINVLEIHNRAVDVETNNPAVGMEKQLVRTPGKQAIFSCFNRATPGENKRQTRLQGHRLEWSTAGIIIKRLCWMRKFTHSHRDDAANRLFRNVHQSKMCIYTRDTQSLLKQFRYVPSTTQMQSNTFWKTQNETQVRPRHDMRALISESLDNHDLHSRAVPKGFAGGGVENRPPAAAVPKAGAGCAPNRPLVVAPPKGDGTAAAAPNPVKAGVFGVAGANGLLATGAAPNAGAAAVAPKTGAAAWPKKLEVAAAGAVPNKGVAAAERGKKQLGSQSQSIISNVL